MSSADEPITVIVRFNPPFDAIEGGERWPAKGSVERDGHSLPFSGWIELVSALENTVRIGVAK